MISFAFLDWPEKRGFPRVKSLGKKCIIVLDRATYLTQLTPGTKLLRKSHKKADMIAANKRWTRAPDDWPIMWETMKTNPFVFKQCQKMIQPPKYLVLELADKFTDVDFHININFLPVAHPELILSNTYGAL